MPLRGTPSFEGVSQFYIIPRLSGEALINVSAHFPVAGKFHIDAMLPALLCGELFGISIEDGVTALQTFTFRRVVCLLKA